jgi:hypothetical protein
MQEMRDYFKKYEPDAVFMPGQQYREGGAAKADDDITLTEEEQAQVLRAWRGLIEDRAHNGRLHYSPVPVGGKMPGSYPIPRDVFAALGQGDIKLGAAVIHQMFGIEDSPERPDLIHPHVLKILGEGSARDGRRILDRFFQRVRQGAQPHDDHLQPDGTRPARIVR